METDTEALSASEDFSHEVMQYICIYGYDINADQNKKWLCVQEPIIFFIPV